MKERDYVYSKLIKIKSTLSRKQLVAKNIAVAKEIRMAYWYSIDSSCVCVN